MITVQSARRTVGTMLALALAPTALSAPLAGTVHEATAQHTAPGRARSHRAVVPPRTGVYAFDVYAEDDRLHLLEAYYAPRTTTALLRYRYATDDDPLWSAPVRVDEGARPALVAYRGIDPQIAAAGKRLVAVWTTAGDDIAGYGTGPLATAISSDGGRTWKPGPNPADSGLTTGHEFIDVAADASGTFHLLWIDDREDAQGIRRGLRYARSTDGGLTWTKNATLDRRICACCWVHLRVDDGDTLYALFRNVEPDPSDMLLFASTNRGEVWEPRGVAGAFGWQVYGCPHTTAGFAMTGGAGTRRLHAVVQTGKEGQEGIYYVASGDDGRGWSSPLRMADGFARYADLAAAGNALASVWQESRPDKSVIVEAVSVDAGRTWSAPKPLSGGVGAGAGYPRIARWRGGFRVLWVESAAGGVFTLMTRPRAAR